MNIGMKRSHSQSQCSLIPGAHQIRTKGRVGRDPVHPLCFKKKSSLHLGSRALAFDASYGTCYQCWIKSRSSGSPYK